MRLGVRGIPVVCPGKSLAGPLGEQQADDPDEGDADDVGAEPEGDRILGQLRAHHDGHQHGDHDRALQDEGQARGLVGQGAPDPDAEGVQRDEHDRLDGDTTQDVADGDIHLAVQRGGDGDRDFGKVGGDGEQDEPAQRRTQVESVGEHVGVVRQRDPRDPDGDRAAHEQQQCGPERQVRQQHVPVLPPPHRCETQALRAGRSSGKGRVRLPRQRGPGPRSRRRRRSARARPRPGPAGLRPVAGQGSARARRRVAPTRPGRVARLAP